MELVLAPKTYTVIKLQGQILCILSFFFFYHKHPHRAKTDIILPESVGWFSSSAITVTQQVSKQGVHCLPGGGRE